MFSLRQVSNTPKKVTHINTVYDRRLGKDPKRKAYLRAQAHVKNTKYVNDPLSPFEIEIIYKEILERLERSQNPPNESYEAVPAKRPLATIIKEYEHLADISVFDDYPELDLGILKTPEAQEYIFQSYPSQRETILKLYQEMIQRLIDFDSNQKETTSGKSREEIKQQYKTMPLEDLVIAYKQRAETAIKNDKGQETEKYPFAQKTDIDLDIFKGKHVREYITNIQKKNRERHNPRTTNQWTSWLPWNWSIWNWNFWSWSKKAAQPQQSESLPQPPTRPKTSTAFSRANSAAQPITSSTTTNKNNTPIPGLTDQKAEGDGHCFYNAVAIGREAQNISRTANNYRGSVADYIRENPQNELVINTLTTTKVTNPEITDTEALANKIQGGQWADDFEINALMRVLKQLIVVVGPKGDVKNLTHITDLFTEAKTNPYGTAKEILNSTPIFVRYNDEDHYDALVVQKPEDAKTIFTRLTGLDLAAVNSFDVSLDTNAIPHVAGALTTTPVRGLSVETACPPYATTATPATVVASAKIHGSPRQTNDQASTPSAKSRRSSATSSTNSGNGGNIARKIDFTGLPFATEAMSAAEKETPNNDTPFVGIV